MNIYDEHLPNLFHIVLHPPQKIIELNLKMGCFKIRDSKNSTTEMVEIADSQRKTSGLTVPSYCGTTCQYHLSVLEGNVDTKNCHIWKLFFQAVISRAHGKYPRSEHTQQVHPSRMDVMWV